MHLTIMALGSRGDVQPYVGLGRALKNAGYEVRLSSFENFESLVTGQGLEFHPVRGDVQAMMNATAGQSMMDSTRNPIKMWRGIMEVFGSIAQDYIDAFSQPILQQTDAILCQIPGGFFGYDLAEKCKIPYITLSVIPLEPTADWPLSLFPVKLPLGGRWNRVTYRIGQQLAWQPFRGHVNRFRKGLGLAPSPFFGSFRQMQQARMPVINGFSEHVVPRPADWGDHVHVTGYWQLDEPDWMPPDDLLHFLEAGAPPVFIGFGSMPVKNPQQTTKMLVEALQKSGQRGMLSAGWGGLGDEALPDTIFKVDYAPYPWLFKRMAAVIHHGGSGTTAMGLRSGVPSMIVPFSADQPYWGSRVYELGAGAAPIPFKDLTADNLAASIQQMVTDERMKAGAIEISEKLAAEDGIGNAVALIQRLLGG